jgi:hypothetical protein
MVIVIKSNLDGTYLVRTKLGASFRSSYDQISFLGRPSPVGMWADKKTKQILKVGIVCKVYWMEPYQFKI